MSRSSASRTKAAAPVEEVAAVDLWSRITDESRRVQQEENNFEQTILVVGMKKSGKTTLLNHFLKPTAPSDEKPKETVALEYLFGRKTEKRELVHLYELGGGQSLADLIDIPLQKNCITTSAVVLCLNLSQPTASLESLCFWLGKLRAHCEAKLSELSRSQAAAVDAFIASRDGKWANHPDFQSGAVRPFPVPLLVVATNYDTFANSEPEQRKSVCKAMRYLVHTNGGSLVFFSKDKQLSATFRSLFNPLAFASTPAPSSKLDNKDHTKPLCVLAGLDSLEAIGQPQSTSRHAPAVSEALKNYPEFQAWLAPVFSSFPPTRTEDNDEVKDIPEDLVDGVLNERKLELKRLAMEQSLSERLEGSSSTPASLSSSSSSRRP
eukprot:GILI01014707.1.p1 GENE.GILI01014707.1~~GILI01014707.1.p1  ORF type:complete len:379 (+),score=77.93 GILI01014707.1:60-1196(+)